MTVTGLVVNNQVVRFRLDNFYYILDEIIANEVCIFNFTQIEKLKR